MMIQQQLVHLSGRKSREDIKILYIVENDNESVFYMSPSSCIYSKSRFYFLSCAILHFAFVFPFHISCFHLHRGPFLLLHFIVTFVEEFIEYLIGKCRVNFHTRTFCNNTITGQNRDFEAEIDVNIRGNNERQHKISYLLDIILSQWRIIYIFFTQGRFYCKH